ncbi:MAG: serine/threonine protein kinase, partial [Defluviitaleaceae bacterium]|nr:serine/threonine protein kinase [Defluviitaleaceae bacterium]
GDSLGFGPHCEMIVDISIPEYCSLCFREIPAKVQKNSAGMLMCNDCDAKQKADRSKEKNQKAAKKPEQPKSLQCEICNGELQDGSEKRTKICMICFQNPEKALNFLLKHARSDSSKMLSDMSDFKMVDVLGKGGMGEVWRVENQGGNQYAMKLMLPHAAASDMGRKTFLREAQMLMQLNHDNVVTAHRFGEMHNMYYILMELCQGGSLDNLIRKSGGKLDINLATDIILQALDGLIYTHNAEIVATDKDGKAVKVRGVVHRDFKPANIFLTNNGSKPKIKIADFGLAKAFEIAGMSGHTRTGAAAGTPPFMPRQQIIDFRYANPAVDVWAAAASYYFMLTGYYPKDFKGEDIFLDALNTSAIPIKRRNSLIPDSLAEVIDQALIEKPKIGIQTAEEFKKMILKAI